MEEPLVEGVDFVKGETYLQFLEEGEETSEFTYRPKSRMLCVQVEDGTDGVATYDRNQVDLILRWLRERVESCD